MKQCGRCGTQNLDQQATCSACGQPLAAAVQTGLGGTLVLDPERPAAAAATAAPPDAAAASPDDAAPPVAAAAPP
ncbi:MAG TPA: hypothetical protein VIW29_20835, partial [Polyangiaceae bacterium]